jgi:serpin B
MVGLLACSCSQGEEGPAPAVAPPAGKALGPAVSSAVPPSPDMATLVEGANGFAVDLYGRLRGQKGNLFLSPASITLALAMTYGGARGTTAEEMRSVLGFTLPDERLHPAFAALSGVLKPREGTLRVANRLWGQQGYEFLESFLALTRTSYGAELETVDFAARTEEARQRINAWIERQTEDKIKELLKEGVLTPQTALVLTNAIYFKGLWATQFKPENTQAAPFKLLDGTTVTVPLMHQKTEFSLGTGEGCAVLELPYKGGELSMVIVLPNAADGLPALEASLSRQKLAAWMGALRPVEVKVYLPRFKATSSFALGRTLCDMGMPTAFSGGADFSGMSAGKDLAISEVVHQAFVDVNEEGTEAAAATAVVIKRTMAPVPVEFRADHPFLFFIRDVRTGLILFMGRLVAPAAAA